MIPLNIILVGHDDEALAQVRREVLNNGWTIEAEIPTAEKVLDRTASLRDRTRLFIVLTPTTADLDQVRLLSGRFVGFPIMAVVGRLDQKTLLDFMRAGAAQIVVLPLQADDFKSALTQMCIQFARPGSGSQVVAVAGVHGGCGATTLAVNFGYEVAFLHELYCILVELSLRLGQTAVCLDVNPKFSLADVAGHGDAPDTHLIQQILHKVTDHFSLISGPCDGISREGCSAVDAMCVVDLCRTLADVIVLDVPCTYDSFYFEAFQAADKVVLVAEQTVPSVRALALVLDRLKRDRAPDCLFAVFNRFDPGRAGFTADKLAKLLDLPKVYSISMDAQLRGASDSGGPLRLRVPRSPILGDLARLTTEVLGITEPKKEPRQGVMGLLKKIGIG
ncbi:MAG: AAA family ATPase [Pirellulales bacterium]